MIEFVSNIKNIDEKSALVYGVFQDEKLPKISPEIDQKIEQIFDEKLINFGEGKVNKILTLNLIKNSRIYLIGLGKKADFSYKKLEKSLKNINYRLDNNFTVFLDSFKGDFCIKKVAKIAVKNICYFNYKFDEYQSKKIDNNIKVNLVSNEEINEQIIESYNIATAISNTKDLVNKPYNYLSAIDLADYAKDLVNSFENDKVKIKVYNKSQIQELKMNAFLGVNKGSTCEPRLIHITYQGEEKWENPVALVGKGLMYDTGGYSLKSSMNTMKCDMAGAATVLGVLEALVNNNVKRNVSIIICATDNRINGEALLPDDILVAMNGKTIEIISTDAEGRLTLADGVCFAQKQGNKEIIDIATLTGAVVVALGDYITGVFGNNQDNINKFIEATKCSNEDSWQLPITEQIRESVRSSKVADLTNSIGRYAGASGAAAFIEAFIEEDTKWIHLDIAGTAYHTSPVEQATYGATGAMVESIYKYLKKN